MTRLLRGIGMLSLVLAAGCSTRGEPPDLSRYRIVVSNSLFAWSWGGAAGFEGEEEIPIRVLFQPEPAATNYRLLMCNPAESPCDAVSDYGDMGIRPRPYAAGFLREFRTGVSDSDLWLVVIADRDDELLTSDVMVATPATRPTRYVTGGLSFDRREQQLQWKRLPDDSLYVLLVQEPESSGGKAVGIATLRKEWTYAQLFGIVRHLHDPASVRDLVRGKTYYGLLFSLNDKRWATLVTDVAVEP